MKAGEELPSGNVRSVGEACRDVGIASFSGVVTGAIEAMLPGGGLVGQGFTNVLTCIIDRGIYSLFDSSMSKEEKIAYIFNSNQMYWDFVTDMIMFGVSEVLKNVNFKGIWNKLNGGNQTNRRMV